MPIDLETDDLRPVNDVVKARLGKRVSQSTIRRWRHTGVNGARLEVIRVGGIWVTTVAAFAEFLRSQTETASAPRKRHRKRGALSGASRKPRDPRRPGVTVAPTSSHGPTFP
jgi:Protein of unknown function (DUF1580)